jgi:hypothetical protein
MFVELSNNVPCPTLGVWDFRKSTPGMVENVVDGKSARSVTIARDPVACKDPHAKPLGQFYHYQENGSTRILVGIHVITREIRNWVWATFWWHDVPDAGPWAAERPASLKSPWNHYLMNVAYDMDLPRETDARPHIAYNPYLEGFLTDGVVSNCVTCHRRATWPMQAHTIAKFLASDGRIQHVDFSDSIVRGSEAAVSTWFDTPFETQLKVSFLWSLAKVHDKPLPDPPAGHSACPGGCPPIPAPKTCPGTAAHRTP